MLDTTIPALEIIEVAIVADGGTVAISVRTALGKYDLFIDGRIGSKMRGEIWNGYPDSSGANLIDPDSVLVRSIKKLRH